MTRNAITATEVYFRFSCPVSSEAQSMFESGLHSPPGLTVAQEFAWYRVNDVLPGGTVPCGENKHVLLLHREAHDAAIWGRFNAFRDTCETAKKAGCDVSELTEYLFHPKMRASHGAEKYWDIVARQIHSNKYGKRCSWA